MIARMLTGFVALLVVVACGTTGTSFADRQPASSDVAAVAPTAEAETAATVDAPVVPLNVDTQGTDDAARAAEEAATVAPTATSAPTVVASEGSGTYFVTLAPGAALPTDEACARLVRQNSLPETHPENHPSRELSKQMGYKKMGSQKEFLIDRKHIIQHLKG